MIPRCRKCAEGNGNIQRGWFLDMSDKALTLDELRKMDGEPVWLVNQNGGRWVIMSGVYLWNSRKNADYGKTWLAYRQKPEEDDHGV